MKAILLIPAFIFQSFLIDGQVNRDSNAILIGTIKNSMHDIMEKILSLFHDIYK